ncbi:hypothetical protein CWI80_04075 [Pseudidiomarina sediminum]|uniref:Glycosyltransferase RgtA/B/C/D-like domain-containing protein n=1 Tax=Pseudidiomarina sediminum TaxID=431675 RepID=A0A432Z9B5_9GAMM|nr:hypothetical protein [Pseudidiomarina sediminum]RUO74525.1 hypothetical protein CWI80_04075 [Pseudidiomarina sediminum]
MNKHHKSVGIFKIKSPLFVFCFVLALKLLISLAFYGFEVDKYNFIPLVGDDEYGYYYKSIDVLHGIQSNGLLWMWDNYFLYTGSHHFIYYFLLAPIFLFEDPYLVLLVIKSFVYAASSVLVYKLSFRLYNRKTAALAAACFVAYIPMHILSLSFMRDDIMFFCIIGGVYYAIQPNSRKSLLLLMAFIAILFGFRLNAAVALIVFVAFYNLDLIKTKKGKLLSFFIMVILIYFLYIRWELFSGFYSKVSFGHLLISTPYEIVRFILSPLPLQLTEELPLILKGWYVFSFWVSVIALFCILRSMLNRTNWRLKASLIAMVLVYILPYIVVGDLGFRQQSVIAPLLFGLLVVPVFTSTSR